ncbi:MAG: ATP-binding protein [Proteobacteria bacterium]|nr:ATP-binding protein [Pseudomonadota bacterium]
MALVSGPRQVGKTTTCRMEGTEYLNWDNADDRRFILKGPGAVAERLSLGRLREQIPIVVFDELHKQPKWKAFLKGFFDVYGERSRVIVTGSSRLDVFRRGGDSLMGRYFLYRMHPYSVGECLRIEIPADVIQSPRPIGNEDWNALWNHGGFPEPFLRRDVRFSRRWRSLRHEQLIREDVRTVAQIETLGALETLSQILAERSAQQLIYSNLSQQVGVSVDTAKRWVDILERLHYGFVVRPWFANVTKALRKEPKWFLRDWSDIADPGQKAETFVACHLLKAVEGWTDLGLGAFELRYMRDKLKREVDFLVVRDRKPWFLVEVKSRDTGLSDALGYFQKATKAKHAFQAIMELPYVNADCFARNEPIVVPVRTLLSQLP